VLGIPYRIIEMPCWQLQVFHEFLDQILNEFIALDPENMPHGRFRDYYDTIETLLDELEGKFIQGRVAIFDNNLFYIRVDVLVTSKKLKIKINKFMGIWENYFFTNATFLSIPARNQGSDGLAVHFYK